MIGSDFCDKTKLFDRVTSVDFILQIVSIDECKNGCFSLVLGCWLPLRLHHHPTRSQSAAEFIPTSMSPLSDLRNPR